MGENFVKILFELLPFDYCVRPQFEWVCKDRSRDSCLFSRFSQSFCRMIFDGEVGLLVARESLLLARML